MVKQVFLSLGSNLGHRQTYLACALLETEKHIGRILKRSPVYETHSWGFKSEEQFLNQVILVECDKEPEEILQEINNIEKQCGRIRHEAEAYSSRTLDIDILYYGNLVYHSGKLIIPHPRLQYRKFVLQPLNDLDPEFIHPLLGKSNRQLLADCVDQLVVKTYKPG